MDKPLYDSIRGLAPTISIEQKAASGNPRSTVGTITEIHDYLRVLWARVGRLTCHNCGRAGLAAVAAADRPRDRRPGRRARSSCCWPRSSRSARASTATCSTRCARRASRARASTASCISLEDEIRLDKKKKHTIEVVVDRLVAKDGHQASACTTRWRRRCATAQGIVIVAPEGQPEKVMSQHRACHDCGISFPEPTPQLFSFNSPQGMCPECSGLGTRMEMDPELVVPNPDLTVNEGAVKPLGAVGEGTGWGTDIVRAVARERGIDLNKAVEAAARRRTARSSSTAPATSACRSRCKGSWGSGAFRMRYEGAINSMMRRMRETQSEDMRQYYQKFLSNRPCSACGGRRIRAEALGVSIARQEHRRGHRALGRRRLRVLRRAGR